MAKSYKTNLLNWLKTKFYTESEVDAKLETKSDVNHNHDSTYSKLTHNHDTSYSKLGHNHNDTYYTESEVDTKLDTKAGLGVATGSSNGLMSKEDKNKLDGIATSATLNVIDTSLSATSTNPVQNKVITNALEGKAGTSTATSSSNGLMSSSDKSKLDGIAAGATKVTVDTSLSSTSTNPVQNKVINSALSGKASSSHNHDSTYAKLSHTHDDRYYTESELDAKITALNNTISTLSKAYLKNSLIIKIGRASDGEGEDGTKIEVNTGNNGIYAQLYCDDSSYSLKNRTIAFLINGVTYERVTDSTGKSATLNINLDAGNYLLTAFIATEDGMNPTFVSKRIIAK